MHHQESSLSHSVSSDWICAQIGSREHYSIPRVLHQRGQLRLFMTDFWATDSRLVNWLPAHRRQKVAERFHPELKNAAILTPGDRRLFFDFRQKILKRGSWEATIRRNEWFQQYMLQQLQGRHRHLIEKVPPGTFFSYSYAARDLLRFFRARGWRTVLGQIDPGPREEEIVAEEIEREREFSTSWERAPTSYWEHWIQECALADEIWVNSPWSSEALIGEGISKSKIRVVPLVYSDESEEKRAVPRNYPERFSSERPLRVLFLGQINVRKGAHLLMRAAQKLSEEPIEFWMIGPTDLEISPDLREDPRFRWTGPVSRKETTIFYQEADLFILPTLSDGFALTQFEAQSRGLPVLASRYCGAVVQDGRNGLLLDPLNEETIIAKLRYCLENPQALADFSRQSYVPDQFQLSALRNHLERGAWDEGHGA